MTMADGKRKIYNVDEDVFRRVVAGDTSALNELDGKTDENKETTERPTAIKETGTNEEDYKARFLTHRLTGTRRQTYIHDSLYRAIAGILPVIAPEMSVPTFVNNVLSDHLERYGETINRMYNETAQKRQLQWRK